MKKMKFSCEDCLFNGSPCTMCIKDDKDDKDDESLHDDIYFSIFSADFDLPYGPIDDDFSNYGF